MTVLNRRRFLAASAASAASAGTSAIAATGDFDVVIIGAGAAGIAAARRLAGAQARNAFIEASRRLGGRCFTGSSTFGGPVDRGAPSIHVPDPHPVSPPPLKSGFEI